MRPNSIVNFERLYLLSVMIGVVAAAFQWDATVAMATARGLGSNFVVVVQVATVAVLLSLWWFVARRRSNIARWILAALIVIGLIFTVPALSDAFSGGWFGIVRIVQALLELISVGLLFTPTSSAWFAGARAPVEVVE